MIQKLKKDGETLIAWGQWLRKKAEERPLTLLLLMVTLVVLGWVLWQTIWAKNTGFGTKTLWDWLDLLIIPIVLAVAAFLLNRSERRAEQEIAAQRTAREWKIAADKRHQEALEAYFERASALIFEHVTYKTEEGGSPVPVFKSFDFGLVLTTQTHAVLRALDGKRKGQVLQFLANSDLISTVRPPIVNLSKAELRFVDMIVGNPRDWGADQWNKALLLRYVDTYHGQVAWSADLANVNLSGADLYQAALILTNLRGSFLKNAYLREALLLGANLSEADLTEADVSSAYYDDYTVWPQSFDPEAAGAIFLKLEGDQEA